MKRIFFFGIASLFILASCKKTVEVIDPRSDTEPASYMVDKPTDTLTNDYLANFCYGYHVDDLISQKITTNKGKQRVYLVSCPQEVVTPGQVRKYLDDLKYEPLGIGYLLKLVNEHAMPKGMYISSIECGGTNMRDNNDTWKPLKELLYQRQDYGSGCFFGFNTETGNNWSPQVYYLCKKK